MGESVEVLMADLAEPSRIDGRGTGPMTSIESILAQVRADVVNVERGSVDRHFLPLGARVRKRAGLPSESMKDICRRQPIRSLAEGEPPCAAWVYSQKITFALRGLTPGRRGLPPWRRRHVIPNRISRHEHHGMRVFEVDDFFHELRRYG